MEKMRKRVNVGSAQRAFLEAQGIAPSPPDLDDAAPPAAWDEPVEGGGAHEPAIAKFGKLAEQVQGEEMLEEEDSRRQEGFLSDAWSEFGGPAAAMPSPPPMMAPLPMGMAAPPRVGGAGPGGPPMPMPARGAAAPSERLRDQARRPEPRQGPSSSLSHNSPQKKRSQPVSERYEMSSEELQLEASGARAVETGWGPFKNVIVPPNVYVVHTRRGRPDPVTIGLGKSFSYRPMTDSYIVVPAAMQTIGIFAKCISMEKQGINVLAYVQWLISDFAVAYKRLDFSNVNDPMSIVNLQLREQAEAAIKDTVSTMTVEQVLKDKAPIIQELTERMKSVAEGRDGDGLGLKIVTVQIKEALLASTTLWQHLQAPFRNEKERVARLSGIQLDAEIHARSREALLERESADARANAEIAKLRAQVELETFSTGTENRVKQAELSQRAERAETQLREEAELQRAASARRVEEDRQKTELATLKATTEREREEARAASELELEALRASSSRAAEERRLELERAHEAVGLEQELALARLAAERVRVEDQGRLDLQRLAAEEQELQAKLGLDRARADARLAHEQAVALQRLRLLESEQTLQLQRAQREAEIERTRQETANLQNPNALQAQLIEALPEIAGRMPAIAEYKYLGFGGDGPNGGGSPFGALPEFLGKVMGIATSFGWRPSGSGGEPPLEP